tara:strand:+ start:621 stop:923 length:303 start_codon:yes stop_codon:yes gene_type:complete
MGKMKEIWAMHEEGYSVEYIAKVMKTNTVDIKNIIYPALAPHISNAKKDCEHDEAKMIDEYQEIGDSNNMAITQWFECDCGATGTRMYVIPAEITWGEEE